jgi:hypothetical protein
MSQIKDVKLCKGCGEVKELKTGYYKAGKYYQGKCKLCQNKNRHLYKLTNNYKKKGTGFGRLDKEIQDKIVYDIYVKISFKEISKKYGIKYATLLSWKKKGLYPQYSGNSS